MTDQALLGFVLLFSLPPFVIGLGVARWFDASPLLRLRDVRWLLDDLEAARAVRDATQGDHYCACLCSMRESHAQALHARNCKRATDIERELVLRGHGELVQP